MDHPPGNHISFCWRPLMSRGGRSDILGRCTLYCIQMHLTHFLLFLSSFYAGLVWLSQPVQTIHQIHFPLESWSWIYEGVHCTILFEDTTLTLFLSTLNKCQFQGETFNRVICWMAESWVCWKIICKCPSCVPAPADKQKPETCLINSNDVCCNISPPTWPTFDYGWALLLLKRNGFNISSGSVFGTHVAGTARCGGRFHFNQHLVPAKPIKQNKKQYNTATEFDDKYGHSLPVDKPKNLKMFVLVFSKF